MTTGSSCSTPPAPFGPGLPLPRRRRRSGRPAVGAGAGASADRPGRGGRRTQPRSQQRAGTAATRQPVPGRAQPPTPPGDRDRREPRRTRVDSRRRARSRRPDGPPSTRAAAGRRRRESGDGSEPADGTSAAPAAAPTVGTIYLDCSPLGADDVRDSSRTKADALTAVTEALDTDGGVAPADRRGAGQQEQWSTGRFPFCRSAGTTCSSRSIRCGGTRSAHRHLHPADQGPVRRHPADGHRRHRGGTGPGTRIVYFLPENRHDDRTVRVEHVEQRLRGLAADNSSTCGWWRSPAATTPARRATPRPTWRRWRS